MNQEKLTRKEINTLIDALEAWENKDMAGELISGMMEAMIFSNLEDIPPEAKSDIQRIKRDNKRELEQRRIDRKEESLILKAKLLSIRQSIDSESVNELIENCNKQHGDNDNDEN